MLDQPTEGRVYPQWHRYLDHQEQGCLELPSGKTQGFVFPRFQPSRYLVCQGQYPLSLWFSTQTSQGNDEQGRERQSGVGHSPTSEKIPYEISGGQKQRVAVAQGHHHLTRNPPR